MTDEELRRACDNLLATLHNDIADGRYFLNPEQMHTSLLAFSRRMQAVGYECSADAIVAEHRMGDRDGWLDVASKLKAKAQKLEAHD